VADDGAVLGEPPGEAPEARFRPVELEVARPPPADDERRTAADRGPGHLAPADVGVADDLVLRQHGHSLEILASPVAGQSIRTNRYSRCSIGSGTTRVNPAACAQASIVGRRTTAPWATAPRSAIVAGTQ